MSNPKWDGPDYTGCGNFLGKQRRNFYITNRSWDLLQEIKYFFFDFKSTTKQRGEPMLDLKAIRERCEKATKGPWYPRCTDDRVFMNARFVSTEEGPGFTHDNKTGLSEEHREQENPDTVIAITLLQSPHLAVNDKCDENADFIAHSRTDIEQLLEAVEQAREIIDGLLNENHTCTQDDYSNCKYCASNSRGEVWLARFK
jgi:hypothetical protein